MRASQEREDVDAAPAPTVHGDELVPCVRAGGDREAEAEGGGVGPAALPEAPPAGGERGGLEREQAENLQAQRVGRSEMRSSSSAPGCRHFRSIIPRPTNSEAAASGRIQRKGTGERGGAASSRRWHFQARTRPPARQA
jgi:hypothetical protein